MRPMWAHVSQAKLAILVLKKNYNSIDENRKNQTYKIEKYFLK